MSILVSVMMA